MNMLHTNKIKEIKRLAIEIDHQQAFGGKSKGNKHLQRVVRIATFLASKMKANKNITIAGAWLHDTALPSGNDYDYEQNKRIIMGILQPLQLEADVVHLIAECVASHEGTKKPELLEAKIVHDSDVIEKLGLLGIIRHTWKLTNSHKIDYKHITDADIKTVVQHIAWRKKQLHLPISKKIARRISVSISQKILRIIVPVIAELAYRGVITEKIAKLIEPYLSKIQKNTLRKQLNLSYLIN